MISKFNEVKSRFIELLEQQQTLAMQRLQIKISVLVSFWFCLLIFARLSQTQISPTWISTAFMETRSFIVVNNNQKLSGTYTLGVTFSSIYPSPEVVLGLPQMRIVANTSQLGLKSTYTSLSQSGFTHQMTIASSTQVWYLQVRYLVYRTDNLGNQFQTIIFDAATTTIDTGSGTRTFTTAITLRNNITLADSVACQSFNNGFTATSVDHYQINISCTITLTNKVTLAITVYTQTKVTAMTVYLLIWDNTYLAIASYYFVDYHTCTSKYGVQTTFFTLPYNYIDSGYIGGLGSISTRDNYQFNITLNSLNYVTSNSSLYDDVPQFHMRTRSCAAPYTFYNKVDSLCYIGCPNTTYPVQIYQTCQPCHYTCQTCLNSTACTTCQPLRVSTGSSLCTCQPYYYQYYQVCYACHYSCLSCTYSGQYFNCLSCDPAMNRTLTAYTAFNYTCYCKNYFTDSGVTLCSQICGDGIAYLDQCDDSNTVSGDGCSSTCTTEFGFTCTKNSSNISICTYTNNVTLTIVKINKLPYENTAEFYIKVTPWISLMCQLATTSSITSNISLSGVSASCNDPYLVFRGSYSTTLEATYARIDLKNTSTSTAFSTLPPANVTFMISTANALKLQVYTSSQYSMAVTFSYVCLIFSYIILASSILFCMNKFKWIGNSMFLSLQFMYLSMTVLDYLTPMQVAFGKTKMVTGYNELLGVYSSVLPSSQNSLFFFDYSIYFDFNVNFMLSMQGLAIVLYAIFAIVYFLNKRKCQKEQLQDFHGFFKSSRCNRILYFFRYEFFMYWTFFNLSNILVACALMTETSDNVKDIPMIIVCLVSVVLCICSMLFKRADIPNFTSSLYKTEKGHEESLMTLAAFICMYLLLLLSIAVTPVIYYVIIVIPIIMMVYLICRKPFNSRWVASTYFVNCFFIILTLVFNIIMLQGQNPSLYMLPIGNFVFIVLDWFYNLIVLFRQYYMYCKYGNRHEQNVAESIKNQEEQEISYFKRKANDEKDNQSHYKPIITNRNRTNSIQKINGQNTPKKVSLDETMNSGRNLNKNALTQSKKQITKKSEDELKSPERLPNNEETDLKKKRDQWMKQMKEMKEIRDERDRNLRDTQEDAYRKIKQTNSSLHGSEIRRLDQSRSKNQSRYGDGKMVRYM